MIVKVEEKDGTWMVSNGVAEQVTGLSKIQACMIVDMVSSHGDDETRKLQSRMRSLLGIRE